MASLNVQLVQKFYAALGDKNLDGAAALLADDIQIHQGAAIPWGGVFAGKSGFRDFVQLLFQSITTVVELSEFVDSENKVVAIGTSRGRANNSGRSFDIRIVHLWEVESGRLSKWEIYIDVPAMQEALGGS